MARAKFVKAARKANPVAEVGESYFWWKFRFGGKHYSKTQPKPSQLTGSEFLSAVYAFGEDLEAMEWSEDLEADVQSIAAELTDLASEQYDKLSNMPDGLQEGPTGELLQGRNDMVEEWANNLESINFEIDVDYEADENLTDEENAEQLETETEDARQAVMDELSQFTAYEGE